jgi:hypothetical protein
MRRTFVFAAILCVGFAPAAVPQGRADLSAAGLEIERSAGFGSIPLYFVANRGQEADGVLFAARTSRYTLALNARGLTFAVGRSGISRMIFAGARPDVKVTAADPADYRVNFFYGSGPGGWMTDVPTAKAVVYEGLYPGIDLKVYGVERQVEYDWLVRAGADPGAIAVAIEGADRVGIDGDGNLVLANANGELIHRAPVAFQKIDGRRVAVEAAFEARGEASVGFRVGRYDRSRDLVIDPYIIGYSTYLGAGYKDIASAVGVDGTGAVYVAGRNYEYEDIASPPGPYDRGDNFVTKIAPDGQSLVYTSYFSVGKINKDWVRPDLAVDAAGNAYLVGLTNSNKFPVKNAFQSTYQGGANDGFIVKIGPTGKSLVFSSYLGGGGHDAATGVAVDGQGAVYIVGETLSADFPLAKPYQKKPASLRYTDAFVTKLSPAGDSLAFSTFLGGSHTDVAQAVAVDASGAVYVLGGTLSANFPLASALQPTWKGSDDFFVTKFDPDGQSLGYSTFLGGSSVDSPFGIAVGTDGSAVVVGYTMGKFPVKSAFQAVRKGTTDGVIAKLSPNGKSLVFSSYLGGFDTDIAYGVAVRDDGVIAVTGRTQSTGFPLKGAVQKSRQGSQDAFVVLIPEKGMSLLFSTYLGGGYSDSGEGVTFDAEGRIIVTGYTNSLDFPLKDGVQNAFNGGSWDSFVTRYQVK